ncbi:MAG: hypothetical protein M1837_007150 [Sclerophora amabilis]|nr:MAG: hypothetical protein M1837_007150 [Sclerophora amabilis]
MPQGRTTVERVLRASNEGRDPEDTKGFRYEETADAKGPIPVIVLPPQSPQSDPDQNSNQRPKTSPSSAIFRFRPRSRLSDDLRRDSGLAPTTSTVRDSVVSNYDACLSLPKFPSHREDSPSTQSSVSLPNTETRAETTPATTDDGRPMDGGSHEYGAPEAKARISMDFTSGSLLGLSSMDDLSFSKRGSILLGGKKARGNPSTYNRQLQSGQRPQSALIKDRAEERILSVDDEQLSQRVRAMYECGDSTGLSWAAGQSPNLMSGQELAEEAIADEHDTDTISVIANANRNVSSTSNVRASRRTSGISRRRESMIQRDAHEIAGGIEDWEDIDGRDIDRYGFISPRRPASQGSFGAGSSGRAKTPDPPPPQRVSTVLQMASEAPRRRRTLRRTPSSSKTMRSETPRSLGGGTARQSPRPTESLNSYQGSLPRAPAHRPFRYAANRLPGRKNQRLMDEAGDMLTLPPGLADIAEDEEGGKMAMGMKKKEWERAEKWRKMARMVEKRRDGKGMVFDFDTRDPKVISRTWKGIPDRWRATAWHAFLSASARKRRDSPSDEELVNDFYDLLDQSSSDDVQIDLDVPRTINSHIMFRRRYRGGQRLLFRVLHALALYFPDVGYVQGMASLAATFLCYFDEETAFVMLVRLWQLRGLERLYKSGFGGLMEALEEFEQKWLAGGDVAKKLTDLGVGPTAYGTRWYLTLFNYSIPFAAQLRVWDVFLLLGDVPDPDPDPDLHPASSSRPPSEKKPSFHGGLDVLHATSAALIDGTREILLDSDFENVMKVLTSWIPVRDEDLLMKVAKVEWKKRRRRNGQ